MIFQTFGVSLFSLWLIAPVTPKLFGALNKPALGALLFFRRLRIGRHSFDSVRGQF
ncbi:MAG: hypothetical protein WBE14_20115 [Xanthobacteraceae bacterium]|jgi:hypothetical protein